MKNQIKKISIMARGDKGFTLIELLIVIAIIGVLAATVIVSIGSQTGKAGKGSAKLGVSSTRTVAFAEVAINTRLSGDTLCDNIYNNISGEKEGWQWTASRVCSRGALIGASGLTSAGSRGGTKDAVAGEICCFARGGKWVIWSALPGTDGETPRNSGANPGNDIYCADSSGFLGELPSKVNNPISPNTSGSNAKCK